MDSQKVKPEDLMAQDGLMLSDKEITAASDTYQNYYKWRNFRTGMVRHFRGYNFEDYLKLSRELFWNSLETPSDDLAKIGLTLSIPFARKEVMDLLGRVSALQVKPRIIGDDLDSLGIKVLYGMYKKWAFKSNQPVETFWKLLYGFVNGTVPTYIGFNNTEFQRRYLTSYDPATGEYGLKTEKKIPWNDVIEEVMPLEDVYFPKIFERDIQKQGKLIWKKQYDEADFRQEFKKYGLSKYVFPGKRISEDSLFFQLLGGAVTGTMDKIEVMREWDTDNDTYKIVAGGLVLNRLKHGSNIDIAPNPFAHKMLPVTWGIMGPLDEKFAYGLSTPFQVKDPHKIMNTAFTMIIERELRAVDPVILTSDVEAPELIYGQHKVIPVNDINAYKEFKLQEPSAQFYQMINSLSQNMSADAQGGDSSVVPSKQPKSAREVVEINEMKQQAMANITTMYYNMLRQQVMLVLKTALQFYSAEKYSGSDKTAIRTILATDVPLSLGGVGHMKIRIVNKKKPDMELFLESIKTSIMNGQKTEIVEVPVSFLENLEFEINKIELDQDGANELQIQSFVDTIITPMLNTYVPMGLADGAKVMMRHLEKAGESISDYAPEAVLQQLAGKGTAKTNAPQQPGQGQPGQGQITPGATAGNLRQSVTGTNFGGQQNGGLPTK